MTCFAYLKIVDTSADKENSQDISLVEIGPRFVMTIVRIFEGSFGGRVLYNNEKYVSPNTVRSNQRYESGNRYTDRVKAAQDRKLRHVELPRMMTDDVDEVFQ